MGRNRETPTRDRVSMEVLVTIVSKLVYFTYLGNL